MSSYEDRLHRRNLNLALIGARYVQAEVEVAIKDWVTEQEDAAKKANQPPYRLLEPLSPQEIMQLVIKKLGFIAGAPVQGELESADGDGE